MNAFRFSKDHEWVKLDEEGNAIIGITDYAQRELGDVVYVELPEPGRELKRNEDTAVVESVKAASDVKSPISGTVLEVNTQLGDTPETVNADPTGAGWFLKLRPADPSELDSLMNEEGYNDFLKSF